jgi:hypothetical protein
MLNDEAVAMTLQPRLEFLASVAAGKSTENSVFEFFDKLKISGFDLEHDPDLNEYRVREDTYLIRISTLPYATTAPPKSDVLLITIEGDDFLELQTLRDVVIEADLSSQFQEIILVWDTDGATRSWFSYISLHVLENQLRKVVISKLMGIEDEKWWNKRIKPLSGGTYAKYKKTEENASDVTHYPDDILFDIFYTDLSTLEKIVSNSDNWQDAFEDVFRTKRYIQKLSFLNRLRRKIAHNRFLTERNQKDLQDLYSAFVRAFRNVWRS